MSEQQSACGACGVSDCPSRHDDQGSLSCEEREHAGARLASAAILTFLAPLVCALIAAALVPGGEAMRIAAAFAGLALGTIIASRLQARKATA